MAERDVVHVDEHFELRLLVPDLPACVPGVSEDRTNRAVRPRHTAPVVVPRGVVRRWRRNPVTGQALGDRLQSPVPLGTRRRSGAQPARSEGPGRARLRRSSEDQSLRRRWGRQRRSGRHRERTSCYRLSGSLARTRPPCAFGGRARVDDQHALLADDGAGVADEPGPVRLHPRMDPGPQFLEPGRVGPGLPPCVLRDARRLLCLIHVARLLVFLSHVAVSPDSWFVSVTRRGWPAVCRGRTRNPRAGWAAAPGPRRGRGRAPARLTCPPALATGAGRRRS
jgi:hypothetical protein